MKDIKWHSQETSGQQYLVTDQDGKTIAVVYTNKDDADLIESAPELRDTLYAILGVMNGDNNRTMADRIKAIERYCYDGINLAPKPI